MISSSNQREQHKKSVGVTNLRLKFPGARSLLFKDLSFEAFHGEKILLLGPSGCGKSTLLQVLSGLIPHSIEVPIRQESVHLPNSYGFVFQDPDTQFCMPYVNEELAFVLENLQVPREQMENRMNDVLDRVGLHIPLQTLIQDLSQGMKQRLALASVLLLDPEVVFLDEPSALLDPEGTVQIWDSVKEVSENKTVIIVEHKINQIADWVDRIVLFNDEGKIIADGAPEVIFEQFHKEITEYGIWHPNVWENYIESESFKNLMDVRATTSIEILQKDNSVIQLKDFKGYYGKKEKIHVNAAAVYPRSWITIIGDNGAGKSTLVLALMRLIHGSGEYIVNGRSVSLDKKKRTPPKELSLVFQNPELQFVENTIKNELLFSLQLRGLSKKRTEEEAAHLLRTFHLNVDDDHHPYQLSTGQKRRLSVATAFAHHSEILILDEPTFGQDAQNTFGMLEQLEEIRQQGTTIVMVTHDLNIVKHFATEVWTIDNGQLKSIKQSPYATIKSEEGAVSEFI